MPSETTLEFRRIAVLSLMETHLSPECLRQVRMQLDSALTETAIDLLLLQISQFVDLLETIPESPEVGTYPPPPACELDAFVVYDSFGRNKTRLGNPERLQERCCELVARMRALEQDLGQKPLDISAVRPRRMSDLDQITCYVRMLETKVREQCPSSSVSMKENA
jgi:hypothetical protein